VLVFDVTALEALFRSHPPVWTMWRRADTGRLDLGFPAAAIAEAADLLKTTASSWDAVLWPAAITVLPLNERVAVELAEYGGQSLGVRHALWEARAMDCRLVTRDPSLYAPGAAKLLVV
jgi:hypothetical protein